MNIAILETGLFPDQETMDDVVTHLLAQHNVYRYELHGTRRSDQDWDQLLDEILAADRILTI